MLVRHAERCRRRLAVVDFAAPPVHLFAEAFAPELLEPKCKFPQRLRIREQDKSTLGAFPLQNELDERGSERRILEERLACLNSRSARAVHECVDIESQQCRRQGSDGRENTEAAADVW